MRAMVHKHGKTDFLAVGSVVRECSLFMAGENEGGLVTFVLLGRGVEL